MRIFVIGGTGFIGRWVVKSLAAAGHEVTVLHRGHQPLASEMGAVEIIGDRAQLADLAQPTDVVLDMIASSEASATQLLEAFRGKADRFVVMSSADVYRAHDVMHGKDPGPPQPIPIHEDAPLRSSRYPYRGVPIEVFDWLSDDYDKMLTENTLRSLAGSKATVLRLPMVYGPGDPLHRFRPYLRQMDSGAQTIALDGPMADWRGCWGFVENVADAIALACAANQAAGKIYNVADPEPLSFSQLILELGRVAGWQGTIDASGTPAPQFRYDQHWHTDTARIRQDLGYHERVPRDQALKLTADWERSLSA